MTFSKFSASPLVRHWGLVLSLALGGPAVMAQPLASAAALQSVEAAVLARGSAGVSVTVDDVLSELQRAPEATRQAFLSKPESVQQLVSNLLVRRALAKEAELEGQAKDPLVAATINSRPEAQHYSIQEAPFP